MLPVYTGNDFLPFAFRLESKIAPLHQELREMREREKRLASDFNELEEENCSLQKTLAHLKQQQLAIDSLQHESARLEEESAFWKAKSEEEESIKNGENTNILILF